MNPNIRSAKKKRWLAIACIALVPMLFIMIWLDFIRLFAINSPSMNPTVQAGDKLLMEGFTYHFRSPRRGEIVAYKGDHIKIAAQGVSFCSRLVGLPGDEIRIENKKLYINGKEESIQGSDGVIVYQEPQKIPGEVYVNSWTIPAGHYFVLGDSNNSFDSRYWGPLPADNIRGRFAWRIAPSGRFGALK